MSKIIRLRGLIDIHVHLRDPGQTYKEDFYTGTCSALAGGVTTILDMPNNLEPIFTQEKLLEKIAIAQQKAVCDYGFYFGTDGKNTSEFEKVTSKVVGLKVYLNLTTGKILIEDEELVERVFKFWPKKKVLVVHAEGEKVDLALSLASRFGNKLHITHISKKDVLGKIIESKKGGLSVTCDVTPHHLFLTKDNQAKLSGFGAVKPPLESRSNCEYLWSNIKSIDCIATDHAPHSVGEKRSSNPPSGMPGLETMLPLLLTAVRQKRITTNDVIRLTNINPQKIFGIKQDNETLVEVDLEDHYLIENRNLITKCGWSPFDGWDVYGKVKKVYLRGKTVFEDGKILVEQGFGKKLYLT